MNISKEIDYTKYYTYITEQTYGEFNWCWFFKYKIAITDYYKYYRLQEHIKPSATKYFIFILDQYKTNYFTYLQMNYTLN